LAATFAQWPWLHGEFGEFGEFLRGIPDHHPNDCHKGSYVGNRLDTQEAIDFFPRGFLKAPFKVGKLSEVTQIFQLLEEGEIARCGVLDTSVS